MAAMTAQIDFVDSYCMVGRSGFSSEHGLGSTDAILGEADRCGIVQVLAHHAIAREWDPLTGNQLLIPLIREDRRVLGAWVADPLDMYRPGAASAEVGRLLAAGFVAVRMYPDVSAHNYVLSGRGARAFVAACADRDVPVFIETEWPDWAAIDALLEESTATLILTGISYRRSRNLYPMMDAHPRLLVESSTFLPHVGIEDVVARFGVGRVLFGTRMPSYSAGAAIARVLLADLTTEEQAEIAGKTLIRLIEAIHR